MTTFDVLSRDDAPEDAQPILQKAEENYGFVPNLLGVMSNAPALAEGYFTLSGIFGQTSLSAEEQQVVLLTVSRLNSCHYCVAAHSGIGKQSGLSDDAVEALRSGGEIPDARLQALASFTRAVVEAEGFVSDEAIETFLGAGFERQNVLEVVLGIGLKTLSNYTNHIAETPLDEAFQPLAWEPEKKAA